MDTRIMILVVGIRKIPVSSIYNSTYGAAENLLSPANSSQPHNNNNYKTEYMVMTGGISNVYMSNKARVRKNTGVGETYNVRALQKVTCDLCGKEVSRHCYLPTHQTKKSCRDKRAEYTAPEPALEPTDDSEDELKTVVAREPVLCEVSMPGSLTTVQCPSINCTYVSNDRNKMRNHFAQCHIGDRIKIQQEGLLPQCNRCGFCSTTVLTAKHLATKKCADLTKRRLNLCRLRKQLRVVAKNFIFKVGDKLIKKVRQFKYLGRIVDDSDKDDSAIDRSIQRARGVWARLGKLLAREDANPIAMGIFYKVIVQSVLLYGSESWVITKSKMVQLRSFHRRCARHITRTHIRQEEDGTWIHPSSEGVLEEAGLRTIEEYIQKRRDTVEAFAATRPLYEACSNSTPLKSRNHAVWWNQVHFSQNDENENVHGD